MEMEMEVRMEMKMKMKIEKWKLNTTTEYKGSRIRAAKHTPFRTFDVSHTVVPSS